MGARQGVNAREQQRRLGHSSMIATNRYIGLVETEAQKLAEGIDAELRQHLAQSDQ